MQIKDIKDGIIRRDEKIAKRTELEANRKRYPKLDTLLNNILV